MSYMSKFIYFDRFRVCTWCYINFCSPTICRLLSELRSDRQSLCSGCGSCMCICNMQCIMLGNFYENQFLVAWFLLLTLAERLHNACISVYRFCTIAYILIIIHNHMPQYHIRIACRDAFWRYSNECQNVLNISTIIFMVDELLQAA